MKDLRIIPRFKRLIRMIINTVYMIFCGKHNVILLNVSMEQIGNSVVHQNIGDDINFYLVKELSKKNVFNYVDVLNVFKLKNYMCIGSIMDWMTNNESCIWGSGVRDNTNKLKCIPHDVLAVRGPLSRQYLIDNGVDCPPVYGDSALLLPLITPPHEKLLAKYRIGIILHKNDIGNNVVRKFVQANENITMIDIMHYKDWHDVIHEIQECEMIISSSLHGLIISDAYNIPNVWIKFSDETFDGCFKYMDYMESVGRMDCKPFEMKESTSFDDIYILKDSYEPIHFDIEPLLSVCPFLQNKCIGRKNGK